MALKFDNDNINRMREIENVVARAVVPFSGQRTEGLLVVFALLRCARVILRQYPLKVQKEMKPLVVDFMEGKAKGFEDGAASSILKLH